MRSVQACVLGLMIAISFASATPSARADHWQHHDGKWSYWHDGDKRWYYTDGSHWFYERGGHWTLYKFDHAFGRKDFVKGDYRPPVDERKVVLPFHVVVRIK